MTENPSGAWVAQQARRLAWELSERTWPLRFLLHVNDAKFTAAFDEVFRSEGTRSSEPPLEAPRVNAIAERFVGTVRRECLDWLLITNRRHLERVLGSFLDHYNGHRPHRALGLAAPDRVQTKPLPRTPSASTVNRRDRLGGLIHEYRPDLIRAGAEMASRIPKVGGGYLHSTCASGGRRPVAGDRKVRGEQRTLGLPQQDPKKPPADAPFSARSDLRTPQGIRVGDHDARPRAGQRARSPALRGSSQFGAAYSSANHLAADALAAARRGVEARLRA